jgi:uncharacterized membrane protein YhaH (DUF805 family)
MDVFALLFSLQGRIGRATYWLCVCVMLALSLLQFLSTLHSQRSKI